VLETLAAAAVSIGFGAVCAIRLKAAIIVVISVLALLAAASSAILLQDWSVGLRIVMMMVLFQASYVAVAAFAQNRNSH
jgi:hypothetical protein